MHCEFSHNHKTMESVISSGVRTGGRGIGGQNPSHERLKKNTLFGTIRLFLYRDFRNCCHVFLCYRTCLLILRYFHCDAIIPVVKLFWWAALEPTTNSKCKLEQSQWVLLKLESCCDVIKPFLSRALSWLDNTTFQRRRYSWKRMDKTQADVPLAMSSINHSYSLELTKPASWG